MITKTARGFATKEEAQAHLENLEATYGQGYGFYPRPIGQSSQGDFFFIFSLGSSCD